MLVVVCAMLILSRVNEARSNAAPAAPTDLILPPDIQTTAKPDVKKYDDLPNVDISSWEYLIASQAHNISDYVPDVSKISGSQSTFDSRAVDALNALPCERVYITSADGLRLTGRYYPAKPGAPLVIACHGYRGTPSRDFSAGAEIYRSMGLSLIHI